MTIKHAFAKIAVSVLLLSACAAEPTPIPVSLPTASPTVDSSDLIPFDIRIALAPSVPENVIPAADLAQLRAAGTVDTLTAAPENSSAYDLYITFGDELPNAQTSLTSYRVAAAINPSLAPLDDPAVAAILRDALDPVFIVPMLFSPNTAAPDLAALADFRARLANSGYPDGFDLALTSIDAFGSDAVRVHAARFAVNLLSSDQRGTGDSAQNAAAFALGSAHLALFTWTSDSDLQAWRDRLGAENVLDLFALPIRYTAASGISITFTPSGFPIPSR